MTNDTITNPTDGLNNGGVFTKFFSKPKDMCIYRSIGYMNRAILDEFDELVASQNFARREHETA